jgi:hypothetical protein
MIITATAAAARADHRSHATITSRPTGASGLSGVLINPPSDDPAARLDDPAAARRRTSSWRPRPRGRPSCAWRRPRGRADPGQHTPGATFDESTGGETAEIPRPPEVVIVKMPRPAGAAPRRAVGPARGRGGGGHRVRRCRASASACGTSRSAAGDPRRHDQPAVAPLEDTTPAEVEQARKAIRNLGFKERQQGPGGAAAGHRRPQALAAGDDAGPG